MALILSRRGLPLDERSFCKPDTVIGVGVHQRSQVIAAAGLKAQARQGFELVAGRENSHKRPPCPPNTGGNWLPLHPQYWGELAPPAPPILGGTGSPGAPMHGGIGSPVPPMPKGTGSPGVGSWGAWLSTVTPNSSKRARLAGSVLQHDQHRINLQYPPIPPRGETPAATRSAAAISRSHHCHTPAFTPARDQRGQPTPECFAGKSLCFADRDGSTHRAWEKFGSQRRSAR